MVSRVVLIYHEDMKINRTQTSQIPPLLKEIGVLSSSFLPRAPSSALHRAAQ
jgi:hypothetical protein